MLRHGLQGIQATRLYLPRASRRRPDPDRLQWRYKRFLEAIWHPLGLGCDRPA